MMRESLDDRAERQVGAVLGNALQSLHQGNAGPALKAHHGAELNHVAALDAGLPGDRPFVHKAAFGCLASLLGLGVKQPKAAGPQFFFEIDCVLGGQGSRNGLAGLVQTAISENSHISPHSAVARVASRTSSIVVLPWSTWRIPSSNIECIPFSRD